MPMSVKLLVSNLVDNLYGENFFNEAMGGFNPHQLPSLRHSLRLAVLYNTGVWQTQRQTDRPTTTAYTALA